MHPSRARESACGYELVAGVDSTPRGCWFEALHWSTVGDPKSVDTTIMDWARERGYIVFTHDLDFGSILASTGATGPSVIQVRTQDVTLDHLGDIVINSLHQFEAILHAGAIISVDEAQMRSRILPLT